MGFVKGWLCPSEASLLGLGCPGAALCVSAVILHFSYASLQAMWHYAGEKFQLFTVEYNKYEIFRKCPHDTARRPSTRDGKVLELCKHLGNTVLSQEKPQDVTTIRDTDRVLLIVSR